MKTAFLNQCAKSSTCLNSFRMEPNSKRSYDLQDALRCSEASTAFGVCCLSAALAQPPAFGRVSEARSDSRQAADTQLEREERGQGVQQMHLTGILGKKACVARLTCVSVFTGGDFP